MAALALWGLTAAISAAAFAAPLPAPVQGTQSKSAHPAMSGTDVLIDVGHGGVDPGTIFGALEEKHINLAIARKTYEALRQRGLRVMLNRDGDYALSSDNRWLRIRSRHRKDLAQRSQLANDVKPKLMLSLHVNASRRAAVRGPLLLHQKSERSKTLAELLQHALNPLYGATEEPRYGKTYYLLRHTKVPTVIVEMGFLTNAEDRRLLQAPASQQQIAERIAQGVAAYLAGPAR